MNFALGMNVKPQSMCVARNIHPHSGESSEEIRIGLYNF